MRVDIYKVRYHIEHGVQMSEDSRTVHHLGDAKEMMVGVVDSTDLKKALLAIHGDAEGIEIKGADVMLRHVEVLMVQAPAKKKKTAPKPKQ